MIYRYMLYVFCVSDDLFVVYVVVRSTCIVICRSWKQKKKNWKIIKAKATKTLLNIQWARPIDLNRFSAHHILSCLSNGRLTATFYLWSEMCMPFGKSLHTTMNNCKFFFLSTKLTNDLGRPVLLYLCLVDNIHIGTVEMLRGESVSFGDIARKILDSANGIASTYIDNRWLCWWAEYRFSFYSFSAIWRNRISDRRRRTNNNSNNEKKKHA